MVLKDIFFSNYNPIFSEFSTLIFSGFMRDNVISTNLKTKPL
jgi:hypothetical protein